MLTISEASEAVKVSRSLLLKYIKSGKLSATRDGAGTDNKPAKYLIDPAELHRVFPPQEPRVHDAHRTNETRLYEARINDLERRVDDLARERDRYHDMLLLEAKNNAVMFEEIRNNSQRLLSLQAESSKKATPMFIWVIAIILIVVGSIGYWVASRQLSV